MDQTNSYKFIFLGLIFSFGSMHVGATNIYVDDVSTNGNGTQSSPYNNIGDALGNAQPGDTILVLPGTYTSQVATQRDGNANARITLKAHNPADRPIISRSGRVLEINRQYFTIDGFIIDGQFGASDAVRVRSTADHFHMRNCEVKNSQQDGIDISSADHVLIENCRVHHMLASDSANQADAHGIVATGQTDLTIRHCNVFYCTGDCFQTDPNRGTPLWDSVLIENCTLWTGPLPEDAALWKKGQVPGENAIDTKVNIDPAVLASGYRPNLVLRNIISYGFVPGYIGNRAAFNIKEKNETLIENCILHDNEIAFRLRGDDSSAHVTMINCIAYDNIKLIRAEDNLKKLHVYNCTFGQNDTWIQAAGGGYQSAGFDMKNCLFLGTKPSDASHASNLSAAADWFADAPAHNFHLAQNSPAQDAGVDIPEVTEDIEGNSRVSGSYDAGAYEYRTDVIVSGSTEKIHPYVHVRPNPFNGKTMINIECRMSNVECRSFEVGIFNLKGQLIENHSFDIQRSSFDIRHSFSWNPAQLPPGIYFIYINTGGISFHKPVTLLK
jgi:hypothetical protein